MITQINIFIVLLIIFLAFYINFVNRNENYENFTTQPSPPSQPCNEDYLDTCSYDASKGSSDRRVCKKECINTNDIACDEQVCHLKCFDEKCSKWVSNKCEFQPYGTKLDLCIKHCLKKDNCNYIKCKNICYSCKKSEDCLWYKKTENQENSIILQSQDTEYIDPNKPLKVTIFSDVKNDGEVKLRFAMPFNINKISNTEPTAEGSSIELDTTDEEQLINNLNLNDSTTTQMPGTTQMPVTGVRLSTQEAVVINTSKIDEEVNHFMYTIHKTQNKREGTRLGTYFLSADDKLKRKNYNENIDSQKDIPIVEFVIKNLDKNEFYDISLRCYNKNTNHISPSSNIVMVKPDKNLKEKVPRLRKNNTSDTKDIINNANPKLCPAK